MSKHDHPEPQPACTHPELRFCPKCDAVECLKCGAEWKKPQPALAISQDSPWRTFPPARWPAEPIRTVPTWIGEPPMPPAGRIWCSAHNHDEVK